MKKIKSIPPTYFYLCILLCIPFYFISNSFKLPPFPYNLSGIVLLFLGMFLVINSWYLFKKHNTPESFDTSTVLVQDGIYKHSRNPMYLGGFIFLFGLTVTTGCVFSLISPFLFYLIIQFKFIPFEENKMHKTFGEQYLKYKSKVRQWL